MTLLYWLGLKGVDYNNISKVEVLESDVAYSGRGIRRVQNGVVTKFKIFFNDGHREIISRHSSAEDYHFLVEIANNTIDIQSLVKEKKSQHEKSKQETIKILKIVGSVTAITIILLVVAEIAYLLNREPQLETIGENEVAMPEKPFTPWDISVYKWDTDKKRYKERSYSSKNEDSFQYFLKERDMTARL